MNIDTSTLNGGSAYGDSTPSNTATNLETLARQATKASPGKHAKSAEDVGKEDETTKVLVKFSMAAPDVKSDNEDDEIEMPTPLPMPVMMYVNFPTGHVPDETGKATNGAVNATAKNDAVPSAASAGSRVGLAQVTKPTATSSSAAGLASLRAPAGNASQRAVAQVSALRQTATTTAPFQGSSHTAASRQEPNPPSREGLTQYAKPIPSTFSTQPLARQEPGQQSSGGQGSHAWANTPAASRQHIASQEAGLPSGDTAHKYGQAATAAAPATRDTATLRDAPAAASHALEAEDMSHKSHALHGAPPAAQSLSTPQAAVKAPEQPPMPRRPADTPAASQHTEQDSVARAAPTDQVTRDSFEMTYRFSSWSPDASVALKLDPRNPDAQMLATASNEQVRRVLDSVLRNPPADMQAKPSMRLTDSAVESATERGHQQRQRQR